MSDGHDSPYFVANKLFIFNKRQQQQPQQHDMVCLKILLVKETVRTIKQEADSLYMSVVFLTEEVNWQIQHPNLLFAVDQVSFPP